MQTNKNTTIKVIAGFIVIALAGIGIWQLNKKAEVVEETTNTTPTTNTTKQDETPTTATNTTEPATVRKYKDGSYTAEGMYDSPAGEEAVTVTLVLKDDVITAATFTGHASNPASVKLQEQFAAGFKEVVVGKSIDTVNLTVVNGSSLTPEGFNNALVKIKAEAAV